MGIQLNEDRFWAVTLPVTPAAVAGGTAAEQTFTVTGLKTGDVILACNKPTTQAGLGLGNVRVAAANTLAVEFVNDTGGSITPAAETYTVAVLRPEKTYTAIPA